MRETKAWWQSKTIWTSLVGAAFAAATLFGFLPDGVDQEQVVAAVLTVTSILSAFFRVGSTAEIGTKSTPMVR